MKQYTIRYMSDKRSCWRWSYEVGDYVENYDHEYSQTNSLKTAKKWISEIKKIHAKDNPHNFRIYDHWADVDPETHYVPCVYQQDI